MAQSQTNFSTINTTRRSTSLHQQPSFNPIKQTMHRSKTSWTKVPDEMAAHTPVEIGTKGTVGSLIMQEIEYFNQLEISCRNGSKKPHPNARDVASSSNSRPVVGTAVASQKKKRKGGSKLLPSICSMVEISENRPVGASGFGYRNLKTDVKKLQV